MATISGARQKRIHALPGAGVERRSLQGGVSGKQEAETLTTASTIEFDIEKRNIQRDNKPVTIRVLCVLSYNQK